MNNTNKTKNMTILILAAHPDDEILGVGGTAAKYAKDKEKIITAVFSLGELTPMWIKPEIIKATRKKESEKAQKIIGISKAYFLDLKDGRIGKETKKKKVQASHQYF